MPGQNEVALLRDQITEEVNRDAEVIGYQLFASNADMREPDITHVTEEQLRAQYRDKFLSGDRQWLTDEATRDPRQFLRVAQAIGVVHPDDLPPPPQLPAPTQEQPIAPALPPPALASPTPPVTGPIPSAPAAPPLPADGAANPALVTAALQAIAQQAAPQPVAPPPPLPMTALPIAGPAPIPGA